MAGGTWSSQNKTLPGVYIRFRSTGADGITVGERGTVTICDPLSWGPVAQVTEVTPDMNLIPVTGYDITHPRNRFLQEIFKGTNRTAPPARVLLFRPTASGSAQASVTAGPLTATAKYPGVRGNDITVAVTALTDPSDAFQVSTVVDGEAVDSQTAKTVEDLEDNGWVTFSGTGALEAAAGSPLEGGADGTVQDAAYTAYTAAVEPRKFDVMIYDGTESAVQDALLAFIKRMNDENGQYCQLCAAGLDNPDTRYAINVNSPAVLSDGTELTREQVTWWAGGASAGARYNESLTYAQYPGAASTELLTTAQYIQELEVGHLVLFADNGVVRVQQDINSLVTLTEDIGAVFRKNRVVRLCASIANDIYAQFEANYIGVVNNNETGRARFKAAIVGYLLDIQDGQGIQNFTADDVTVEPGEAIDAIVVRLAIQPVDAVEKIYMTVEVA